MRATRRQALAGAAALAAAGALPAVALADDADDRAKAAVARVLDLEQTAEVAYEAIANAGVLTDLLRHFLDQERQHIEQLQNVLDKIGGDAPIPPRRTEIKGLDQATAERDAAARFAIGLELRTVAAYQLALVDLTLTNPMTTFAGAMGTDAQQLVVLRQMLGRPPVPNAFETGGRH